MQWYRIIILNSVLLFGIIHVIGIRYIRFDEDINLQSDYNEN